MIPPIIMREDQRFKIGSQAYVFKGYVITFVCNVVNGTPPITIMWFRNDVLISSQENSFTIEITGARDSEIVSCRAINNIGSDMATSAIQGMYYKYKIIIIAIMQIVAIDLTKVYKLGMFAHCSKQLVSKS